MANGYQFQFRRIMKSKVFCPYCCKPVGYLGNFLSWLLGTRYHNCDWSNVVDPWDDDYIWKK